MEHREVGLDGHGAPGEGGESLKPRARMRQAELALKARWPLSQEQRIRIIEDAVEIVESEQSTPRERLSAMRTIAQFDSLNVAQERMDKGLDADAPREIRLRLGDGDGKGDSLRRLVSEVLREDYTEQP